jgi:hypothetical protein
METLTQADVELRRAQYIVGHKGVELHPKLIH